MEKLVTVALPQHYWEQLMRSLPGGDADLLSYWVIQTKAAIDRALYLASQPRPAPMAVPDNWTDPNLTIPARPDEPILELVYIEEPWWVCPRDRSHWSQTDRDKHIGYCPYCKSLLLPERKSA
jgi:hypothetical protein